jgi:hypothetical protein
VRAGDGLVLEGAAGAREGRSPSTSFTAKVQQAPDGVTVELSSLTHPGTYPPAELLRHRDVVEAALRAARESVHATTR